MHWALRTGNTLHSTVIIFSLNRPVLQQRNKDSGPCLLLFFFEHVAGADREFAPRAVRSAKPCRTCARCGVQFQWGANNRFGCTGLKTTRLSISPLTRVFPCTPENRCPTPVILVDFLVLVLVLAEKSWSLAFKSVLTSLLRAPYVGLTHCTHHVSHYPPPRQFPDLTRSLAIAALGYGGPKAERLKQSVPTAITWQRKREGAACDGSMYPTSHICPTKKNRKKTICPTTA